MQNMARRVIQPDRILFYIQAYVEYLEYSFLICDLGFDKIKRDNLPNTCKG